MNHWSLHAPQWRLVGPPLRPGPADVAGFAARLRAGPTVGAALVLGVTPEVVGLPWAAGAHVLAIDRSAAMFRHNWAAGEGLGDVCRGGVCADWQDLPLRDSGFDVAVGDGSLNALAGLAALAAFTAQLHRVLRPGGRLILRVFIRPDEAEAPQAVFDDLFAGRIGSFHVFKWRLAMALHGGLAQGVVLARIWDCWHSHVPDPPALMRSLGWDGHLTATIDIYRDAMASYTFPTRGELGALFAEGFRQCAWQTQSYELAQRCPIVEWERVGHDP